MAGELPAVAAGGDEVADAGVGAVAPEEGAVFGDAAEADELGAQGGVEPVGLVVGVDDEDRAAPGEGVGEPGAGGGGLGVVEGAGVEESAVAVVVAQDGLVAVAQP